MRKPLAEFTSVIATVFIGLRDRSPPEHAAASNATEVVRLTFPATVGDSLFNQEARNDERRQQHASGDARNNLESLEAFAFHLV
ncbi:MAG: hypothetical protein ACTHK7_17870 [Aureliella sp.]